LFPQADWEQTGQLALARALWRKLSQIEPAAVLVPGWYTAPAIASALWAKLHGRCSILMSETTEADYQRVWWKESLKQLLVRLLFDYGIAGGTPHMRYLARLGFAPDRIARFYDVVNNGFYQERADNARQTPGLRRSLGLPGRYFLYVGRLAPEKNVELAVRAHHAMTRIARSARLVVVGDGPSRPALQEALPGVLFRGAMTGETLAEHYASADVFLFPSETETFGNVTLEAMASGLVVVAYDYAAARAHIESGHSGVLVPYRDADAFVEAAVALAGSPARRLEMRARVRETVAHLHWDHVVARFETWLVAALRARTDGGPIRTERGDRS
jgi:glycosyltransferase involved in cell wall biosynthesis